MYSVVKSPRFTDHSKKSPMLPPAFLDGEATVRFSQQDSLRTRSKAIGIARNVGAHYVLYSSASGNVNAPTLQMQLMLVQTGEIIWSGKGAVSQQ